MPNSQLSNKQHAAIVALIATENISSAAKMLSISQQTLFRWLANEDFRQALLAVDSPSIFAWAKSNKVLQDRGTADKVLVLLYERLLNPKTVEIKAQIELEYLLFLRTLCDFDRRITHMEGAREVAKSCPHYRQ